MSRLVVAAVALALSLLGSLFCNDAAGDLQLKRSIRQFEDAAADADIAIVYYSGLGIGIGGANYLVPVDAKLVNDRDTDGEAVSLQRLPHARGTAKRPAP